MCGMAELQDDLYSFTKVLTEPADVMVMFLWRGNENSIRGKQWKERLAKLPPPDSPYRYPLEFYLDQFMLENAHIGAQKRAKRKEMIARLDRCVERKQTVSFHKVIRVTSNPCLGL